MANSMKVRVLVVDDSGFFQRRVSEIINADPRLEVIATANNGREGVEKTLALKPDVITMDYEMPLMDGVTAVREIMKQQPTPVLMFSSLTYEGARVTLDALEAGAVDFLAKQFDAIAATQASLHKVLTDRIVSVASSKKKHSLNSLAARNSSTSVFGGSLNNSDHSTKSRLDTTRSDNRLKSPKSPSSARLSSSIDSHDSNVSSGNNSSSRSAVSRTASSPVSNGSLQHVSVVIIGTSTGGPAALQTVFKDIPGDFSKPIVIIQHMPGTFTKAFAERLNKQSPLTIKEAEDGDRLQAGHVYVAPGGMQLMIDNRAGGSIHIRESDDRISYRPSVDIALASAAKHFGRKALAVILTGMGADGKEGAQLLKQTGGTIWAQDEASSVIYGMPMAVQKAGLTTKTLSLGDIGQQIYHEVN
jgi:two-component system chemotaxis response regulator CheB